MRRQVLGLGALLLVTGCGSTTITVTQQATAPRTSATPRVHPSPAGAPPDKAKLNNPAQQPDPSVTASCNEVPLGHPCHAVTAVDGDPNESRQRNCDTNIVANASTSCALAENIFWEVYEHGAVEGKFTAVEAHSPVTDRNYEMDCVRQTNLIACESSPIGAGLFVSFPLAAIQDYTAMQATAYARTRDVGHPGPPAAGSTPASTEAQPEHGGSGEEESSQDEVGSYSHAGDEAFCLEHECIGDFEGEDGYVVECEDGSYSHAGGKSGACSDHGGEKP
jgi:hypothetical protein